MIIDNFHNNNNDYNKNNSNINGSNNNNDNNINPVHTGKTPRHLKVTVSNRASKYFPIIAKHATGTLG